MDDIRKERIMISIITLAAISLILQNFFAGWEFWVPAIVITGTIVLWWFHITQKTTAYARVVMCFAYASFLAFYHGVHSSSFFDVSVVITLFLAVFTVADRILMLNLIFIEYMIIMGIQFGFLYMDGKDSLNASSTMKIVFLIGTVFIMYIFSRFTVNTRVSERDSIERWKESVKANDLDMEDFLSNISHELRTPVNVISGMTTLLQKKHEDVELQSIQEAGIRLAHQIEDIQDYTEIKRGEIVLEDENYMVISLMNDVVSNYGMVCKKEGLELVVDVAPDIPTMLAGDIQKLHKIFRHLLDNAIKFTRRGGIFIKVFSTPQEYGVNLTIVITDTGIGMTRADISGVSKGMYQANKKRNRSTGGIGIGLPIVYGFVHKMGGFVQINSEKRRGTTVRISIPQRVTDPVPSLSVGNAERYDVLFYLRPEKFKVPEVRDFYRSMEVDLATGLGTKLYLAGERRELEHIIKEHEITHIFAGWEEYTADKDILDELSEKKCRVVVAADPGLRVNVPGRISVIQKPVYAFPVVRILNGEEGVIGCDDGDDARLVFTGVRALIVDDEPMNLVVASGLVRGYGMSADTAESGKEAIKKYENSEYDIIFMDHMMPEMDGVETMKRIRQSATQSGRIPIVVALTANALSGAREMFAKEGFDGFIAKPIDIGVFEHVMKRVLPEDMIHYEGRDEN